MVLHYSPELVILWSLDKNYILAKVDTADCVKYYN